MAIALLGLSCSKKTAPASESKPLKAPSAAVVDYAKAKYTAATVVDMSKLDGCEFMLKLESGRKLQPSPPLTDKFCVNDKAVWIKYQVRKGAAGICMSGQIVTLIDIQDR
jgi:hypothetical protein